MRAASSSPWDQLGLHKQFATDVFCVATDEVSSGASRLEAAFYGSAGYRAVAAMRGSGFDLRRLDARADVTWLGPFARRWVDDAQHGVGFLSSSDMLHAQLRPEAWISRRYTPSLERLLVRDGQILVSCSGTVGNVTLATADHAGLALSQDAIRIECHDPDSLGPTYCHLRSDAGQFSLRRSKSGSVIDHLYGEDVGSLEVPVFPCGLRTELTRLVLESKRAREQSTATLREAEDATVRSALLEEPDSGSPTSSSCGAGESYRVDLTDVLDGASGDYRGKVRLDAAAYRPLARRVRRQIERRDHNTLARLTSDILYIPKVFRVFVDDPQFGVPLLSGKDLVMQRPAGDKHLSKLNARHIAHCQLQSGWVLVSRSGNIGRVALCRRNYEGMVGSEHILRVIPAPDRLDPGFVYAFLACPFGQSQIKQIIYGSVIQTMSKEQLGQVLIPIPKDRGTFVGDLVRKGFDLRADANELENRAVSLFSAAIVQGRQYVESEWGKEY